MPKSSPSTNMILCSSETIPALAISVVDHGVASVLS
jgi:hypothetical protein